MKKVVLILLFPLFIALQTSAASCGGVVQCNCGDSLVSSQTMWYDIANCGANIALSVNASNLTLDCAGHQITGGQSGSTGVGISGKSGVTVKNCKISKFPYGIEAIWTSPNVKIIGNTITETYSYGIKVASSSDNSLIEGNFLYGNRNDNIAVITSRKATIRNNIVKNGFMGIRLDSSRGLDEVSSNTLENLSSGGLIIYGASNGTIFGNIFKNNRYGIYAEGGFKYNKISGNTFESNSGYPLYLAYSGTYNTIWFNIFKNNAVSAYEDMIDGNISMHNNWNTSSVGNYWSDFASNPGYPSKYIINGPADGIDYKPMLKEYLCGDVAEPHDGVIDTMDVNYLINYAFNGGPEPHPLAAGDLDRNGVIDVFDINKLIDIAYGGAPAPDC